MKLRLPSLHNELDFNEESIFVWEIHPHRMFYRIAYSLHAIANGREPLEDVFVTDGQKRLDAQKLLFVLSDAWAMPFSDRRAISKLYGVIENVLNAEYEKKMKVNEYYQAISHIVTDILNELPLETDYNEIPDLNAILKAMNVTILDASQGDAKSNLMRLIDINAALKMAEIIILINYRELMLRDEEEEVFKQAMYTKAKLLFVEYEHHERLSRYETRWVIDNDYDDYLLKG